MFKVSAFDLKIKHKLASMLAIGQQSISDSSRLHHTAARCVWSATPI